MSQRIEGDYVDGVLVFADAVHGIDLLRDGVAYRKDPDKSAETDTIQQEPEPIGI